MTATVSDRRASPRVQRAAPACAEGVVRKRRLAVALFLTLGGLALSDALWSSAVQVCENSGSYVRISFSVSAQGQVIARLMDNYIFGEATCRDPGDKVFNTSLICSGAWKRIGQEEDEPVSVTVTSVSVAGAEQMYLAATMRPAFYGGMPVALVCE